MAAKRTRQSDDLSQCPCAGQNLDRFIQPAVLAVLVEGALHGYRIVQRLGEMPMFHGDMPDTTGVYRYLKSLERRGMVTSSWNLSESGPAKKLFSLTPAGRQCLRRWDQTLEEYRRQVGHLAKQIHHASRSPSPSRSCTCGKK
jgi:PadR family transcriptional regulator, regulatory protein PadR